MADQRDLALLKQGVIPWNEWRVDSRGTPPDLSGANLNGARLSGADLSGANLNGAHLSHADLQGADLISARLSGADLSHANLITARLKHADLSHANLSHANLSNADLVDANLNGADFHTARLGFTIFALVDLRVVEGLDTVTHEGPSPVDINTVKLPEGETRTLFLQGVGFSDTFIDYYVSLFTAAIQYASCFISYTHQNEALAQQLYTSLQNKGVRCWYAPHDMKIGDHIRSRIEQAIHVHEKLLLLLSEHALKSDWVEDEVEIALEKERRQGREMLFPVRLDDAVMQTSQAWAAKLRRTRHIGDFTRWTDPQEYQRTFERLLHDLKVDVQS